MRTTTNSYATQVRVIRTVPIASPAYDSDPIVRRGLYEKKVTGEVLEVARMGELH